MRKMGAARKIPSKKGKKYTYWIGSIWKNDETWFTGGDILTLYLYFCLSIDFYKSKIKQTVLFWDFMFEYKLKDFARIQTTKYALRKKMILSWTVSVLVTLKYIIYEQKQAIKYCTLLLSYLG